MEIPEHGELCAVVGPMFSGKTGRLLDLLELAERRGVQALAVKPSLESRYGRSVIVSHDGRSRSAVGITSADDLIDVIAGHDLFVVDEVQFFEILVVEAMAKISGRGVRVVAAGLDFDFRGEEFASTTELISCADRIERLVASCAICGRPATHTQRIVGGQLASRDEPTIVVGGAELYQPRCRACFLTERQAAAR